MAIGPRAFSLLPNDLRQKRCRLVHTIPRAESIAAASARIASQNF